MSKCFFDHYVFEGSHRQVGQQYGEALRDQIREHLALIYSQAKKRSGIDQAQVIDAAAKIDPFIRGYAPGFHEELGGLAEGSGIAFEEALLLQAKQEVINLSRHGQKDHKPHELECTSFAIRPAYTADGKMYAGQNADLTGELEVFTNVVTFKVTGKPQVMMVVPAGQLSYQGMSSEGMSANCNYLVCDGWKPGFPRYLLSRLALEQPSYEAACRVIEMVERASSRNILLCHRDGRVTDYETTASDFGMQRPEGPYYVHSNHFLDGAMEKYEKSTEYELKDSRLRHQRLSELIRANKGGICAHTIKQFLRDHENGVHSLCVHPNPPDSTGHTFASNIINLTDGVMEVCRGNPCMAEYATYEFIF